MPRSGGYHAARSPTCFRRFDHVQGLDDQGERQEKGQDDQGEAGGEAPEARPAERPLLEHPVHGALSTSHPPRPLTGTESSIGSATAGRPSASSPRSSDRRAST